MARLFVLVVMCLLVAPSFAHGTQTIRFYSSGRIAGLGLWDVGKNPRLGAAVRHFGEPNSRYSVYGGNGCKVFWRHLGLRMTFANFGGYDACHGQYGYAQAMVIRGDNSRRWRTERGLRIGMASERVPQLHPQAVRHAKGWWLTTYTNYIGTTSEAPGMVARVTYGKVSSFRSYIGGAGD